MDEHFKAYYDYYLSQQYQRSSNVPSSTPPTHPQPTASQVHVNPFVPYGMYPPSSSTTSSSSDDRQRAAPVGLKKKRERWSEIQAKTLVLSWKKHFKELESAQQNTAWLKIKDEVDDVGTEKSLKQIKDKLRNLKDAYKAARDQNKKTGESPTYSPFFDDFDEVLGTRDVINTPFATEIGVVDTGNNSLSDVDVEKVTEDEEEGNTKDEEENSKDEEDGEGSSKGEEGIADADFKRLKRASRGKQKKVKQRSNFQQELLEIQRESLELQTKQEERQHSLIRDIFQEQRRVDAEERERDREFFMKLGALLNNNEKK